MAEFSEKSKKKLNECHPLLQLICNELIKIYDFTILEGYRDEEKQNNYYHAGKSQVIFPNSNHNKQPSLAIDIAPWNSKEPHIKWDDIQEFRYMGGLFLGIASQLNIPIISGGNWDNFKDYPHFELDIKKLTS